VNREQERKAYFDSLVPGFYDALQEARDRWDAVSWDYDLYRYQRWAVFGLGLTAGVTLGVMGWYQIWWLGALALVSILGTVWLARHWDVSPDRGRDLERQEALAEAEYYVLQRDPYAEGEAA
jgi:hypothetical protein